MNIGSRYRGIHNFLHSTPHPPTASLPSLHPPPPGNSCGTNPSHMTWAGGETYVGHPFPLSSPFLSIWMSNLFTHILLLRVWPFCIAGMCSVFVTHTLCLIPYIDEIPDRNFSPLFQSLLVAHWQLKVSIRCKSSITTHAISDIWIPKYVYLRLRNRFSVVQTSCERGVNLIRDCNRNLCADAVSRGHIDRRTEKISHFENAQTSFWCGR